MKDLELINFSEVEVKQKVDRPWLRSFQSSDHLEKVMEFFLHHQSTASSQLTISFIRTYLVFEFTDTI